MNYSIQTEAAYGVDVDHPMRHPAPDGYRRPGPEETVGFAYVCLVCGANVSPSATELHLQWHRAD